MCPRGMCCPLSTNARVRSDRRNQLMAIPYTHQGEKPHNIKPSCARLSMVSKRMLQQSPLNFHTALNQDFCPGDKVNYSQVFPESTSDPKTQCFQQMYQRLLQYAIPPIPGSDTRLTRDSPFQKPMLVNPMTLPQIPFQAMMALCMQTSAFHTSPAEWPDIFPRHAAASSEQFQRWLGGLGQLPRMPETPMDTSGSHNGDSGSIGDTDGCIDLSIAGRRRSQPGDKRTFSVNELAHSTMVDSPKNHANYVSRSPVANSLDCSQPSTPSFISPTQVNAALSIKMEADTRVQTGNGHTRVKNRRCGFQAGITVGYTYDAFFISDGRSRRRGSGKARRAAKRTGPEPRLQLANSSITSSSHSSSSSCAEGTTEQVASSPSILQVSPVQQLDQHTNRYICPECGKSYATSSNLSRHKQTHRSLDSQAARRCPHCGKAYVSMPALSMHILTHDLKHRCDLCGKAFSRPWLLQGHRRAHTGEKPYGCAHCGRAFADRSNLRAHMQTHSTMKQYECEKCRKNFALKSYLNKHMEAGCVDRWDSENNIPQPSGASGLAWSVTRLIAEEA